MHALNGPNGGSGAQWACPLGTVPLTEAECVDYIDNAVKDPAIWLENQVTIDDWGTCNGGVPTTVASGYPAAITHRAANAGEGGFYLQDAGGSANLEPPGCVYKVQRMASSTFPEGSTPPGCAANTPYWRPEVVYQFNDHDELPTQHGGVWPNGGTGTIEPCADRHACPYYNDATPHFAVCKAFQACPPGPSPPPPSPPPPDPRRRRRRRRRRPRCRSARPRRPRPRRRRPRRRRPPSPPPPSPPPSPPPPSPPPSPPPPCTECSLYRLRLYVGNDGTQVNGRWHVSMQEFVPLVADAGSTTPVEGYRVGTVKRHSAPFVDDNLRKAMYYLLRRSDDDSHIVDEQWQGYLDDAENYYGGYTQATRLFDEPHLFCPTRNSCPETHCDPNKAAEFLLPQGFGIYINVVFELAAGDEMAAYIPIAPADLTHAKQKFTIQSFVHDYTYEANHADGLGSVGRWEHPQLPDHSHPTSAGYVEVDDNTGVSNGLLPEMHRCTNLQEYTHFALIDRPPPAPSWLSPPPPAFPPPPYPPDVAPLPPPPSPPDCIWFTFPCGDHAAPAARTSRAARACTPTRRTTWRTFPPTWWSGTASRSPAGSAPIPRSRPGRSSTRA